jgi:hypothetical protein
MNYPVLAERIGAGSGDSGASFSYRRVWITAYGMNFENSEGPHYRRLEKIY